MVVVEYPPGGAWWQAMVSLRSGWMQGRPPWACRAAIGGTRQVAPADWLSAIRRRRMLYLCGSEPPERIAEALLAAAPPIVAGPAKALIDVGEVLAGRYHPRVVGTHAEMSSPEMRAEIAALFGVAPIDGYGCVEAARLAWQCPARDLYHVEHESLVIEITDDDGQPVPLGATGHVVVTTLWNRLAPVVRYRVGDAASLAARPCRCGWAGPALDGLQGRTIDWLVDRNGGRVSPLRLWLTLHVPDSVDIERTKYQVRQDRSGSVTVLLVRREPFPLETLDAIAASYRAVLDVPSVTARNVDAIVTPPGEKFRLIKAAA
jgi:phenylacetate-CoA ligase